MKNCPPQNTRSNRPAKNQGKNQNGFSLIELLVVCVFLIVILGIISIVVVGLQSNYSGRRQRVEQLNDGQAAMDLMSHVIRTAGANTSLQALTPTGTGTLRIRADWNPVDNALTGAYEDVSFFVSGTSLYMRNETTNAQTELMPNAKTLTFTYYDSNGAVTSTATAIARVKIALEVGTDTTRTFTSTILVRKGLAIKTG